MELSELLFQNYNYCQWKQIKTIVIIIVIIFEIKNNNYIIQMKEWFHKKKTIIEILFLEALQSVYKIYISQIK